MDDYYTADIDAPTMPQEYVDRILTSSLPGVDNLSPKLTRRMDVAGQRVVVTGIMPANEIATQPIWQMDGLVGAELKLSCDPNHPENKSLGYKDPKVQRKAVESLPEGSVPAGLVGRTAARCLRRRHGQRSARSDTRRAPRREVREFKVAKVLSETGTIDDSRVFMNLRDVQDTHGHRGTGQRDRDPRLLQRDRGRPLHQAAQHPSRTPGSRPRSRSSPRRSTRTGSCRRSR